MQNRDGATRGGEAKTSTPRPARWVLVVAGGGELYTHPMAEGDEALLGRDLDCDLVLDHHRVSRRHARVRAGQAAHSIEDLGSRNGTRIGERLPPRTQHALRDGELIAIGPFRIAVLRGMAVQPSSLMIDDPAAPPTGFPPLARAGRHVVVRGGTVQGKRMIAEALHRRSGRGGHFLSVECAAVEPEALAAVLFGDARSGRAGALEAVGTGTLFLEDVEALPVALQAQLAAALESGAVVRAGAAQPSAIFARVVAASTRPLPSVVESGAFLLELYYRLAGALLELPPCAADGTPVPIPSDRVASAATREEQQKLREALEQSGGSPTRAARLLGMSRSTLATKLSSYGIAPGPGRSRK